MSEERGLYSELLEVVRNLQKQIADMQQQLGTLADLPVRIREMQRRLEALENLPEQMKEMHGQLGDIRSGLARHDRRLEQIEQLAEKVTKLETHVAVSEFRAREGAVGYRQPLIREFRRLLGGSRGESLDAPRFWS